MIFVDSNVLIDVLEPDPHWAAWSALKLDEAVSATRVCITPIVVAEVAPRYASIEIFQEMLSDLSLTVDPLTDAAAFLAGLAFRQHRRFREGSRSILADFLIGGQAIVAGATILTRDPAIYSRYFPQVPLICPTKA